MVKNPKLNITINLLAIENHTLIDFKGTNLLNFKENIRKK